jgi:hypothetical protein
MLHRPLFVLAVSMSVLCAATGPLHAQEESEWPREVERDGHKLLVYQPQVDAWEDFIKVEARAAVKLTLAGKTESHVGAIWVRADTRTDMESRTVYVHNLEITDVRFPDLDTETVAAVRARIGELFPLAAKTISLDRMLAAVERGKADHREVEIKHEPPAIFYSEKPALLLFVDGDPALSPVGDNDLFYAVNANWDLLFVLSQARYYLAADGQWLSSPKLEGSWGAAKSLPAELESLPEDKAWDSVRLQVATGKVKGFKAPTVFYTNEQAELILVEGKPKLTPIEGTGLLWLKNTQSDVFLDSRDGHYYYLVSGRWFKTKDLDGRFKAAEAPAELAKLPVDHPRAHVRAAVPGTPEAEEAVLTAQIPRTATVQRDVEQPEVTYDGDPKFEQVPGTDVAYAVNTASDVLKVGDLYYLCHQGVWFVSRMANGPWTVADSVPDEIYEIPPSCSKHHTTYVHVYDSTPSYVVVGYTSGYYGMYVWGGTVVYGTGWYYYPYYYPYYRGAVYYPTWYSYGVSAWYNPYYGTYGRGGWVYGPYGGYGAVAGYNPSTGTYARGYTAWGPNGQVARGYAYNPWTGTSATTYQARDAYGQWGESVARRGDDWIHTGHYTDERGTRAAFETSEGGKGVGFRGEQGSGFVARSGQDDLYVGRDGDVYRRDGDGWSRYDDGNWNPVDTGEARAAAQEQREGAGSSERAQKARDRRDEGGTRSGETRQGLEQRRAEQGRTGDDRTARDRPSTTQRGTRGSDVHGGLQRDHRARSQGGQRTRDYGSMRGSGANRGGFRSGGGAPRGGRRR